MKAAVVTKDHHVDVTDKTLRSLKHGEALLKMECCGVRCPETDKTKAYCPLRIGGALPSVHFWEYSASS